MRRLQPLPDRAEHKGHGSKGEPTVEARGKDELAKMKQELDGLEKEELVHHQGQLALAQQRLQQKRRSDLAKRMQEAQRLQILKEKRAELDETRRGKLIHFKQRMLFAAEKSVDREALLMDTLYENIGEAMDNVDGEDAESSVVVDDSFAFGVGSGNLQSRDHQFPLVAAAGENLPLIPRGSPQATGLGQLSDPFRIKSAFEEHWTHERHKYVEQLHALKLMHSTAPAPHARSTAAAAQHHSQFDEPTGKAQPPVLALQLNPLLKTFPGAATRLTKSHTQQAVHGGGSEASSAERPWKYNPAREAHRRVREELKKLVAQSSDYNEADNDLSEFITPPTTPKPSSSTAAPSRQRLEEARSLEARIAMKLNEVEARELADSAREKLVSASIIPREDLLVKGEFILEDAEANILHKMEQERTERERLEKIERQRSASLLASGVDEFALGRARSFKSRKVSVVGEGALEDERRPVTPGLLAPGHSADATVSPTDRPLTPPPSGWNPSRGADDRSSVGRRASLVDVSANAIAGSGKQETSIEANATALREGRGSDATSLQKLPKYMQVVTSAEERHQLLVEQANNRFNLKRAAQREELEQLQRKLDLLLKEEEESSPRQLREVSVTDDTHAPLHLTTDDSETERAPLVGAGGGEALAAAAPPADSSCAMEISYYPPGAPEDTTAPPSAASSLPSGSRPPQADSAADTAAAALRIQCAYRCHAARQERDRREAHFQTIIEARAKEALEEEQQTTDCDALLDSEAAMLRDLVAREQIVADLSAACRQAELESLAAAQRACEERDRRRVQAAITIQRVVRGHQVRLWYASVNVARNSLMSEMKHTSAVTIQHACRGYLGRKHTLLTVTSRRQLKQRYDPFVGDARGIGGIAAVCLQCFFRRLVTRQCCAARRAIAKGELRDTQRDEAAGTIQRQWRRYSLQLEERRSVATDLVAATASVAVQLASTAAVDGARAHSAATTIAKYVRRFLCRDVLRRRWTETLIVDALAEAESIRREADAAAALDDADLEGG